MTRQLLPDASVDVFVNRTLVGSARTGDRGEVLLWVPYSPGLSLTLLGNKQGYVPRPLPWKTSKTPSEYRPTTAFSVKGGVQIWITVQISRWSLLKHIQCLKDQILNLPSPPLHSEK